LRTLAVNAVGKLHHAGRFRKTPREAHLGGDAVGIAISHSTPRSTIRSRPSASQFDHRQKIHNDPEYAQVCRDSRKKWRAAHPGYDQQYRQAHPEKAERNRAQQRQRDQKRR
jgi:hypothetical protein